ncbi:MAG: tetratricopeptide repeat protein [Methylophilus sp.]
MSLLIKALDKAEKAQEEQQKLQKSTRRQASNIANGFEDSKGEGALKLELEQPSQPSSPAKRVDDERDNDNIARAANVFDAKQAPQASIPPLVWLAGLGLLALLGVGFYFYYQLNQLQSPTMVADQRLTQANQSTSSPLSQNDVSKDGIQIAEAPQAFIDTTEKVDVKPNISTGEGSRAPKADMMKLEASQTEKLTSEEELITPARTQKDIGEASNTGTRSITTQNVSIASESVSVQISRSRTEQGVNPALLSAYNAYNAGKDAEAQALYKSVLQKDIRNVDALLGMGAIAERQNRLNDAYGWYGKVLEVEPRNATALAAYYDIEQNGQTKEQKLKVLIAKNANDFNAQADLGAYYAEQNRWAEAQQSYFEAYRLNATADNAFNLAVSLDQMNKPKLALPYYQQALDLMHKNPTHALDESVLQARIQAIQEK